MNRLVFILATFLLVMVLVTACVAPTTDTPAPAPESTTTVENAPTVEPEPEPVSQLEPVFEQAPCPFPLPPDMEEGSDVHCGFVIVPEDRSDPENLETISLAVARFQNQSPERSPDPLMLLAGGPGEKTVDSAIVLTSVLSGLAENRDLIVFDQRGVGYSEPALECPEFEQMMIDMLAVQDQEESLILQFDAWMDCKERLEEDGYNLAAFTTTENAADVHAIRQALGYEQVNLFGGSYGSLLAQAVMRDHPEGIRSVIIDSTLPAEKSIFVDSTTTATNAILHLLEVCASDEACNTAYPDLQDVLFDVIADLNENPVSIQVTHPVDGVTYDALLTGDAIFSNLFVFLYQTQIIPVLPQAIYDIADGDYDLMTQLTERKLTLISALSRGMEMSVLCTDDLLGRTPQEYLTIREDLPEVLQDRVDPETMIKYGVFGICENWPVELADPSVKNPVESDIPALILAGEFDPITPPEYGRLVAEHLSNSHFYEFPGVGHSVTVSNACARSMVLAFLNDPLTAPPSTCVDELPPVVFDLPKEEQGEISFKPFTNTELGLQAAAPVGWNEPVQGTFVRGENALDNTALVYEFLPMTSDEFIEVLMAQLSLDEKPEPTGEITTEAFTWLLHEIEVQGFGVDVATTAYDDSVTIIVIMQAVLDERESLYKDIYLPAIESVIRVEETDEAPTDEPVETETKSFSDEEVVFENGDITLGGTLSLPAGDGPHPAVALISGSGQQDRDETLPGIPIKPFQLIADHLASNGIAVLRYDDRGVGASTGDPTNATSSDFAEDAEAAWLYLKNREEIAPEQIGLLGHSEGAIIAAMLAADNADIAYVISMSGTAVDGYDLLTKQSERFMQASGASDEEVARTVDNQHENLDIIRAKDWEALDQFLEDMIDESIAALSDEEKAGLGDLDALKAQQKAALMAQAESPWLQFFIDYNPAEDWRTITAPVLALFGDLDVQVDVEQNRPALEAALAEAGNEDVTVVVFPKANHLFQEADTGGIDEYAALANEFTPEFLDTILTWLLARVELSE